jgi:DNA-binding transcriptional ArsR family regulator
MSDEKQSEWTTYWNRVNLARRSRIPDATNHTKPVLNDLVSRGDKGTGISHNFLRVLADDMGVSHDVYERGLKPLREAGVVEVTRQHNARGHPTMSRYRVVDEALLALAPKTQLAFREEPTKTQPAFQEALPKTQNAGRLKRKNGPPETQLAALSHTTFS